MQMRLERDQSCVVIRTSYWEKTLDDAEERAAKARLTKTKLNNYMRANEYLKRSNMDEQIERVRRMT